MKRSSPSVAASASTWLLMPSLIAAFAPPIINSCGYYSQCPSQQRQHRQSVEHQSNAITGLSVITASNAPFLQLSERFDGGSTCRNGAFRVNSALFAGRGRPPKAAIEQEEEDDDDLDYDDGDDDEDGEVEIGEIDEIGLPDDDDEEDEDDIAMYEEEYDEDDEDFDDAEPIGMSGEEEGGEGDLQLEEVSSDSPAKADIWASYDAIHEEPVTPLLDDVPSDPLYQQAKETVLSQVEERKQLQDLESKVPRNFESAESVTRTIDYIMNDMTDEERAELEKDVDLEEVERIVSKNNVMLTQDDLKDVLIEDNDGSTVIDPSAIADAVPYDADRGIDAFPSSTVDDDGENLLYPTNGAFTEKDLVELDDKISAYKAARERLANQTYFGEGHAMAYMDVERDWPLLSNETQDEIMDVIENSNTMACPEPEMWLMYDLNFNVTNLILASFKHNMEAPIMFTQWMPQLEVYERYADQREKEFQWTWDDVEQADMEELELYYKGIGYDSIPKKDPSDTGIITLDTTPMDDEEREMLALENWMDDVYNEESDNLLFDDESFEPRDNVYDPDYGTSSSDKSAALEEKFMKEFQAFEREFSEETQEWRDQYATVEKFEYHDDPEGQKEFRGHLVVACTPSEEDMDIAERITEQFREEFGKAVFVETRVLAHARMEDNVFEVWLESYEIDLLHSKRQAFINSKLWTGPSEVDGDQLEYLIDRVRYLISDDARYSYRMSDYSDIQA